MSRQRWQLPYRRYSYDQTGLHPSPLVLRTRARKRRLIFLRLTTGLWMLLAAWWGANRAMTLTRRIGQGRIEVCSRYGTSTLPSHCYSMTPYSILKSRMSCTLEADGSLGGDVIRSERC